MGTKLSQQLKLIVKDCLLNAFIKTNNHDGNKTNH